MSFETAVVQWEAGLRALEASAFDERPILEKVTRLVIVDKIGATPNRFPRRAGLPAREPLGRDSGI